MLFLDEFPEFTRNVLESLRQVTENGSVTIARANDKVLRVARTIANLAGEGNVSATHLQEAIQYRRLDRTL